MTTKADFTPEQWQLLLEIPPLIGTAVMVAGRSGLGSLKEAYAIARGVLDTRPGDKGNELIHALLAARLKDGERSEIEKMGGKYRGKQPEELRSLTLAKCEQVSQLLAEKTSLQEADGYKRWAVAVGEDVAAAAKEGGFLGFGGERVSDAERELLADLRQALSISA